MQDLLRLPKTIIFEPLSDPIDPRLKNIIRPWNEQINCINAGILGIPFDLGVKNSRGRVGAALAPDAIRKQIKTYGAAVNAARNADLSKLSIVDFGDIAVAQNNIPETHSRTKEAARQLFKRCGALIVLGGSNDLSYATISALPHPIGGINVDAHLDVREVRNWRINSGTPYGQLIRGAYLTGKNFFEVGIQGQVNSKYYWSWAKERGVHIWTLDHVREVGIWRVMSTFRRAIEDSGRISASFVSIDIDSIAQAFAPGSSAPSPDGLFPKDILEIAYFAGTMPSVRLFEIMEVNPKYDQDNRTSRLAANIILEFLAGYTKRSIV